MPVPPLPPFRVEEAGGESLIPVLHLVFSGGNLIDNGGGKATYVPPGGGSTGGAPTDAQYVTLATNGDLSEERVLTGGLGVFIADSGAGTAVYAEVNTPFLVTSNRTLTAVYPVQSGGSLAADRSFNVDTAFLVTSNRTLTAVYPVLSGGNLGADRSFHVDTAFLVTSARTLTAVYPVQSGGNLGVDRSFNVDTAFLVTSNRTLTAGTGLSGGGNLGADRTFTVNTNVRDKVLGFFVSSTLTTAHRAEETRIYIPFNMEFRDIRLAVTQTPVAANILVNLYQFPGPISTGSAFFSANSRPIVTTGNALGAGSAGGDALNFTAFAGSWLGFSIDQVGTTSTGQDLTITTIWRTS